MIQNFKPAWNREFFVLSVDRLNVEFCFPECIWFKKLNLVFLGVAR